MFEWDNKKNKSNFLKHNLEFSQVWDFDWENAIRTPDGRYEYGEIRFIAIGKINEWLFTCVYTERDKNYRIISLRKANKKEEKIYEQKTNQ
ncbi:MAG: BrnT family toxin [Rickettsiales bacterium]